MDFLESLDLDTKHNKSCRVRSWYLYEQYKSLENNQLDAAQRLKNKSYQDRILRQELYERRARRKLYDQFGLCHSESRITRRTVYKDIDDLTITNDDIFESHSERDYEGSAQDNESVGTGFSRDSSPNKLNKHDYYKNIPDEVVTDSSMHTSDFESVDEQEVNKFHLGDYKRTEDEKNQNSSLVNLSVIGDYKSTHEMNTPENTAVGEDYKKAEGQDKNNSDSEKEINNIENNITTDEKCDYEYSNENQISSMIIAQDLNKHLESARQNINSLANITRIEEENENLWENMSEYSSDSCKINNKLCDAKGKCGQVFAIWSRLVSFAYQLVQLNHGNCFNDYSCQFLTAVLACDVLRRGVNRMCNILQPCVSLIKFTDDESSGASHSYVESLNRKKLVQSTKSRKTSKTKVFHRRRHLCKSPSANTKHYSDRCGHSSRRCSLDHLGKCLHCRHASEPWCNFSKDPFQNILLSSSSTLWPDISKENISNTNCSCNSKAVTSMLQIACYIDNVIKNINCCKYTGTCGNCE